LIGELIGFVRGNNGAIHMVAIGAIGLNDESVRVPGLAFAFVEGIEHGWGINCGVESDGSSELTVLPVQFGLSIEDGTLGSHNVGSGELFDLGDMKGAIIIVEAF
jgi:hypothetical protein